MQKGGFAIAPTAPLKEGYIFGGWFGKSQERTYNITQNTTFIPKYVLGANSYVGKRLVF